MSPEFGISGSIPMIVKNDNNFYEGDLKFYFRNIFHHAQNLSNPYHNFRHICHVLWLCYEACEFYGIETLSRRKMRNLLIAALFHDFDHTGKAGPDSVNIERAIAGLKKYISSEDQSEFEDISAIIRSTEYPYTVSNENLDLPSLIIRDADLSQAFNVAWIQQVVFGLAAEWDKTPIQILEMQAKFYR
ncbi:MAG: HD domain-containing protein [Patescibacteria group bacterium]